MKASKEGHTKIYPFLTAVNKHSNTHDNPAKSSYSAHRLPNRAACGQDVVNDKDMFTRGNIEVPAEDPYFSFSLSEDAPYSQLTSSFEGQDNASGSWSSNHLYFLIFEVLDDKAAQFLSMVGILQDAKLLPINRRM